MKVRMFGVLAAMMCTTAADAGDLLRCGKWVVDSTITVDELREKCGEPTGKRVVESDVTSKTKTGGTIKHGTTLTEYWTYDRGSRGLDIVVTITDGKIRSIERAE